MSFKTFIIGALIVLLINAVCYAEYLASLKSNSNGQAVLNAFDVGKRRLMENGKLAEIKHTWFGE